MKEQEPKKGDKIYVPTSLYVYRGNDDFEGGLATINKVEYNQYLPEDHYNYIMVGIEERENVMYNYKSLLEQQEDLKKIFGDQVVHSNPDYRKEFNMPDADWN